MYNIKYCKLTTVLGRAWYLIFKHPVKISQQFTGRSGLFFHIFDDQVLVMDCPGKTLVRFFLYSGRMLSDLIYALQEVAFVCRLVQGQFERFLCTPCQLARIPETISAYLGLHRQRIA